MLRSPSGANRIYIPDADGTLLVSAAQPLMIDDKGHLELNFSAFVSIAHSMVGNQTVYDSLAHSIVGNLSHGTFGAVVNPQAGLTLVHFSAQPEPFLTPNRPHTPHNTTKHPLNTPKHPPKQHRYAPPMPQNALPLS